MIYLNPPYQVFDGYTVLSDHADPKLYYVLPSAPNLAIGQDGVPRFSLISYLGGGAGAQKVEGGLLTLTTELRVPDEVLSRLATRLERGTGTESGGMRLVPILFDSGSVELIALGVGSAGGEPIPATGPFQVRFLGASKPSLGGSNLAIFQLVLDAMATELIEKSLEAPDLPIIVIYRMTFAGLRPSFRIDIKADWRQVYNSLKNKAKANIYFVAADAEVMINKTLEENNIKIDTSVFGTSENNRAAAERARKQLTDWVLQHLFTPIADPKSAMSNSIGEVIDDTVWSLARTILPGVSYKLRILDDEQVRQFSARMDEATAEVREVIPQGTLGGMIYHFRVDEHNHVREQWPALKDRLVTKVNLEGFPRLEVQVGTEDRFASDGLSEVLLELAYRDANGKLVDNSTFVLRNSSERKVYVVNLLGKEIDFLKPYQYRMILTFNPSGPFGPHSQISTDWKAGNTKELIVEPRSAYMVKEVKAVTSPTFSFNEFPNITVELRYSEDGNASKQLGRLELNQNQNSSIWRFRSFAVIPRPYEYRITYHKAVQSEDDIVLPWSSQTDDWLSIPDPLPHKRTLNIFISLPWDELITGFIQLSYKDPSHGINYEEQIDLNVRPSYIRKDYGIASDGPQAIAYRLTILLRNGTLMEGSWRETEDTRLLIDRRLVDNRSIQIRTIGPGLEETRLSSIHITLHAHDPQTDKVRSEKEIVILPGSEAQPVAWDYLLGDPPATSIHYSGFFVDKDGFVTNLPWAVTQSDLLVVNLRAKTISA